MLATFGVITPVIGVVLVILALIIFGPGKLPDLGKALGTGIKEFRTNVEKKDETSEVASAKENS